MGLHRFFNGVMILGMVVSTAAISLFAQRNLTGKSSYLAFNSNTYLGPTHSDSSKLVKIQVVAYDSPEQGGLQMVSVRFNGKTIPLKPRDVHGFRGQGSFQFPPGQYKLKWRVQRDKLVWPRTLDFEEVVVIDPRDLWLQISVTGDKASIQ